MFKTLTRCGWAALVVGLTLSPTMAQVTGPVVPGSAAPPVEEFLPGRNSSFSEYLSTTVNGPLALQMIDNVLKDGEVAAEYGHFIQGEDGSQIGVFNVVPLGPVIVPARLVLVRNPGSEMTVVGRQSIKHLSSGAKTEFALVSKDFPDEVYDATLKIDSEGNVVSVSDSMSGVPGFASTGSGIQCLKRCYAQFVFGGYFGWPFLFWFYWGGLFTPPLLSVAGFWTYLYYLRWFQLSACISTC